MSVPVNPGVIAVVRSTYDARMSVSTSQPNSISDEARTLNEHNLQVGVGIGKTTSNYATRWTASTQRRLIRIDCDKEKVPYPQPMTSTSSG